MLQAEEPKPLNAAAAAALQSEYTSKYATKSDAAKINFALLTTSYLIGKATRTKEEVARSVITKCLNSIHGTISYPIALTSYYLAGYLQKRKRKRAKKQLTPQRVNEKDMNMVLIQRQTSNNPETIASNTCKRHNARTHDHIDPSDISYLSLHNDRNDLNRNISYDQQ